MEQERMKGNRPRGRSSTRWTDQIRQATKMPITQAIREVNNRARWREMVERITLTVYMNRNNITISLSRGYDKEEEKNTNE